MGGTTFAATALLAGGAVAAKVLLAPGRTDNGDRVLEHHELTPAYRGGSGTPLLLLHGVTAIWRAWSPVLPHLEPHHDVIAPTLPGHGGGPSLSRDAAPSVDALADALESELDRLGLQRVHIAGNSLGGWLGIELARRGRANSLVLFSPAGAWRSQRSIELRAAAIRRSVGAMARYSSRADVIATNTLLRWPLLAAQVAYPHRVPAGDFAAHIRAGGSAPIVLPLLRQLPLAQVHPLPLDRDYPVRLVWGDRDRVLPFGGFGAAMLERLPGAEFTRLPGVGHVPMSDDPDAVADQILQVTRRVDDATQRDQKAADDA
jgi:pimeloyl-ACP methyl ester carboxylesterase